MPSARTLRADSRCSALNRGSGLEHGALAFLGFAAFFWLESRITLYYRLVEPERVIEVLALWHARRQIEP
jgi:hypothetical protein